MKTNKSIERLVKKLGGQTATATALGVKQPSVNGWLSGKHGMSPVVAMKAQQITGIPADKLCPRLKGLNNAMRTT